MNIVDPLRPYLDVIKWVGGIVLVVGLFVAGCNHGENRSTQANLFNTTELATCKAANAKYEKEAYTRDLTARANADLAGMHQAAGKAASDALRKEREEWDKREAALEQALRNARGDTKCADILQMEVCSVTPVPLRPR